MSSSKGRFPFTFTALNSCSLCSWLASVSRFFIALLGGRINNDAHGTLVVHLEHLQSNANVNVHAQGRAAIPIDIGIKSSSFDINIDASIPETAIDIDIDIDIDNINVDIDTEPELELELEPTTIEAKKVAPNQGALIDSIKETTAGRKKELAISIKTKRQPQEPHPQLQPATLQVEE